MILEGRYKGDNSLLQTDAKGNLKTVPSGTITNTHSKVSVTDATTVVLAENTDRKYALFINDSDTVIYLKINSGAVLNEGIRLNANGGSYEMMSGHNIDTREVNAIHNATGATKNLLVVEGE